MLPIPVFRVEKNANYTTMSNYHLRDNTISFKAKGILGKPFPQEAELAQKSQRLAELNSILDMDGKKNTSERGSEDRDDTDRPSVLDDLHRRVEEMPPYRRTESRELEERA